MADVPVRRPLTAIRPDALEELEPFVLAAHTVQPVAAVGDRHLGDRRLEARVEGRRHDRIAAARAARPEDAEAAGVDLGAGLQIAGRGRGSRRPGPSGRGRSRRPPSRRSHGSRRPGRRCRPRGRPRGTASRAWRRADPASPAPGRWRGRGHPCGRAKPVCRRPWSRGCRRRRSRDPRTAMAPCDSTAGRAEWGWVIM